MTINATLKGTVLIIDGKKIKYKSIFTLIEKIKSSNYNYIIEVDDEDNAEMIQLNCPNTITVYNQPNNKYEYKRVTDDYIFPFGKYKGQKASKVDSNYIDWYEQNILNRKRRAKRKRK